MAAATSVDDDENYECHSPKISTVPQASFDPYFHCNEFVIEDLLIDERIYHTIPAYCVKQTPPFARWMRRTLLNWLRDVSVYHGSDVGVVAHATQLIDRYLHVVDTDKQEYQLVGATCFFIASKLKEANPVSSTKMVKLTDYSVKLEDVLAKELTVCVVLQWDLTAITPVDFVAPIVDFLDFSYPRRQALRRLALDIYLKAFHVEDLGVCLPSYVAAACILYALSMSILSTDSADTMVKAATTIRQLLKLEARKIREVYQIMQSCFRPGTADLSEAVVESDRAPPSSPVVEARRAPCPSSSTGATTSGGAGGYLPFNNGQQQPASTSRILPLAMSTQVTRVPASLSANTSLTTAGGSANREAPAGLGPSKAQAYQSCSVSTTSPSEEADLGLLGKVEAEQQQQPPPQDRGQANQLQTRQQQQ